MPYQVVQSNKSVKKPLYKVYNPENNHYFSKKGLSKRDAEAQLRALYANASVDIEKKRRQEGGMLARELTDQPTVPMYRRTILGERMNTWELPQIPKQFSGRTPVEVLENAVEGEGLVDFIKDTAKKVKNVFTNEYSPTLEKAIQKYKDYTISYVSANRTPVEKILKKILGVISLGKFNDVYESYDDIYHLSLILKAHDPKTGKIVYLQLEKRPNISVIITDNLISREARLQNGQFMVDKIEGNPTFGEMVERAKIADGKNLYTYTPNKYNCQQFVITLLHALGSTRIDHFVLQDKIKEYLTGSTRSIATAVTDLGHIFNRLQGKALPSKLFHGLRRKGISLNERHFGLNGGGQEELYMQEDPEDYELDPVFKGIYKQIYGSALNLHRGRRRLARGKYLNTDVANASTAVLQGIQGQLGDADPELGEILKVVNVIPDLILKFVPSEELDSAKFYQQYGDDFLKVLEKYGINSNEVLGFRYYYPDRLTDQLLLYNTPFDDTSSLLTGYPENIQNLYIYTQNWQNPSTYLAAARKYAISQGLNWDDQDVLNEITDLHNLHQTLSLYGQYNPILD